MKHVLPTGEVIESYPNDLPYPSKLMLGWRGNRPLHVVAADNLESGETIVITVYEPDPQELGSWICMEEASMKCVICKNGQTKPGRATVTLERQETTLVVKNVPAEVCTNCGEEYVDEKAASRLLKTAEDIAQRGVQVDVRSYEAA